MNDRRFLELDGVRGILATIVLGCHVLGKTTLFAEHTIMFPLVNVVSMAAVGGFYLLSGYVLGTIASAGQVAFLRRRTQRLIPMHVACIALGAIVLGATWQTALREEFWLYSGRGVIDAPDWSLRVEMVATIVWPAIILAARNPLVASAAILGCLWMGQHIWIDAIWLPVFVVGAYMRLHEMKPSKVRFLRWAPIQFLGRISFSLYMTHSIVVQALGPWLGLTAAIPIAAVAYLLIEKPSLSWSRYQTAADASAKRFQISTT